MIKPGYTYRTTIILNHMLIQKVKKCCKQTNFGASTGTNWAQRHFYYKLKKEI